MGGARLGQLDLDGHGHEDDGVQAVLGPGGDRLLQVDELVLHHVELQQHLRRALHNSHRHLQHELERLLRHEHEVHHPLSELGGELSAEDGEDPRGRVQHRAHVERAQVLRQPRHPAEDLILKHIHQVVEGLQTRSVDEAHATVVHEVFEHVEGVLLGEIHEQHARHKPQPLAVPHLPVEERVHHQQAPQLHLSVVGEVHGVLGERPADVLEHEVADLARLLVAFQRLLAQPEAGLLRPPAALQLRQQPMPRQRHSVRIVRMRDMPPHILEILVQSAIWRSLVAI
mmetsp:Transcript_25546/g.42779  ORF Transcript_25546/g.42779 Transcript_25546/m.42779 type:complete len:285 (+) Transcript_25546:1053-1907(+)